MYTLDLRCVLTQPFASTSRAFTVVVCLWSPREKVQARFSLCIERSVNCIMANQLIFSIEQHVFIYDQYLLIQSASQVRRLLETRFQGVKIPSCSTVHNLHNKFQGMGSAEPMKQHKPHSVISVIKLTSIKENYSELWKIS